ncbi:hypothetical protein GCM10022409_09560 [Hymenobacter glaciei]|uniref:Uncharacterized protein n=1 Tax=Hymenobacter glaciei TaxID=877209 RepID=A0ABP7TL62_9BACT
MHLVSWLECIALWYCVDFMVARANLHHPSDPEANNWVLLLLPRMLARLIGVRVVRRFALRQVQQQIRCTNPARFAA